ncbi:hypothetical protein HDU76_007883 [Blyttiomyces sp. JEL0837]|nr:hypothetical protein HDU76_007883 [Blyttiomyces sp. JEL0837]
MPVDNATVTAEASKDDDVVVPDTNEYDNGENQEQEMFRKEAFKFLMDIEADFTAFKNRFYQERVAEIDSEAAAVRDGTHKALTVLLDDIDIRQSEQNEYSLSRKLLKERAYMEEFEAAVMQANYEYYRKRAEVRRQMLAETTHQRTMLREEYRRHYLPVLPAVVLDSAEGKGRLEQTSSIEKTRVFRMGDDAGGRLLSIKLVIRFIRSKDYGGHVIPVIGNGVMIDSTCSYNFLFVKLENPLYLIIKIQHLPH